MASSSLYRVSYWGVYYKPVYRLYMVLKPFLIFNPKFNVFKKFLTIPLKCSTMAGLKALLTLVNNKPHATHQSKYNTGLI
jgi:hypothetical protein